MYRTFKAREGFCFSLPLPSLFRGFTLPMGVLVGENGRETGGRTECPSRASALCTKAFRAKTGGKEGHFGILYLRERMGVRACRLFDLLRTISPTASDSQSVGSGLTVRPLGLNDFV